MGRARRRRAARDELPSSALAVPGAAFPGSAAGVAWREPHDGGPRRAGQQLRDMCGSACRPRSRPGEPRTDVVRPGRPGRSPPRGRPVQLRTPVTERQRPDHERQVEANGARSSSKNAPLTSAVGVPVQYRRPLAHDVPSCAELLAQPVVGRVRDRRVAEVAAPVPVVPGGAYSQRFATETLLEQLVDVKRRQFKRRVRRANCLAYGGRRKTWLRRGGDRGPRTRPRRGRRGASR